MNCNGEPDQNRRNKSKKMRSPNMIIAADDSIQSPKRWPRNKGAFIRLATGIIGDGGGSSRYSKW